MFVCALILFQNQKDQSHRVPSFYSDVFMATFCSSSLDLGTSFQFDLKMNLKVFFVPLFLSGFHCEKEKEFRDSKGA